MNDQTLGNLYLKEFESEVPASLRCLERIPERLFDWKPHEKSMNMGYLSLLVADIPRWLTETIEKTVIDFANFKRFQPKNTAELVELFENNIKDTRKALQHVTDQEMKGPFYLKNSETVLMSTTIEETISSTINHWVHHRGQLTVYMRLNNIPVPSIYGPSADEKTF